MRNKENLFSAFPPATKAEWLAKAQKELQGRPWEEMQWQLSDAIRLDPFFHPTDEVEDLGPLPRSASRNSWEIGEYVGVGADAAVAGTQALSALDGGAEALLFQCGGRMLDDASLSVLLQGIELSMISVHFEFSSQEALLQSRPALEALSPWRGSCYRAAEAEFGDCWLDVTPRPGRQVRYLVVDGRPFYQGLAQTAEELARFLRTGQRIFHLWSPIVSAEKVNGQVKLAMVVDASYFVSIAKIRAMKVLWANFIRAYDIDPTDLPEIEVHLAPYLPDSDPYANLIRAATQTLSAAVGGADRIFVFPAGGVGSPEDSHRIARNIQHILKMESYIDRVIDPAAGSYYIEKLTDVLAEEAWRIFAGQ